MATERLGVRERTPQSAFRSALRNISNRQPATQSSRSLGTDQDKGGAAGPQQKNVGPSNRVHQSGRGRYSTANGDLSKLRPKSPPLIWVPGKTQGMHLSPGSFMEDTQNLKDYQDDFSPDYNHQKRHSLPKHWLAQESPSHSDKRPEFQVQGNEPPLTPSTPFMGPFNLDQTTRKLVPISIRGLSPSIRGPLDFCTPSVRSNSADAQGQRVGCGCAVQELDVTTTWDGLRYREAQELYRIHQAFIITLERMLAGELWKICDRKDNISDDDYENLNGSTTVRGISFCRDQLLKEMTDFLHSSEKNMFRGQLGLIQLYLAATDCLVQHDDKNRDVSITVRVHHHEMSPRGHPIVEAVPALDTIIFQDLNETSYEGQEIFIIPRYQSNAAFGSRHSRTRIRYCIDSPHIPIFSLEWDGKVAGFKGTVPMYADLWSNDRNMGNAFGTHWTSSRYSPSSVKFRFIVKAIVLRDNGGTASHERVVRSPFNLEVFPWHVLNGPHAVNLPYPTIPNGTGGDFELRANPQTLSAYKYPAFDQPRYSVHTYTASRGQRRHLDLNSSIESGLNKLGPSDLCPKNTRVVEERDDMVPRPSDTNLRTGMLNFLPTSHHSVAQVSNSSTHDEGRPAHPESVHSLGAYHGRPDNRPQSSPNPRLASNSRSSPPLRLKPTRELPTFGRAGIDAFSAPTPSAIRSTLPSQTFDEASQAWSRTVIPEKGLPHQSQTLVTRDADKRHLVRTVYTSSEAHPMQGQDNADLEYSLRRRYQPCFGDTSQSSTDPLHLSDLANPRIQNFSSSKHVSDGTESPFSSLSSTTPPDSMIYHPLSPPEPVGIQHELSAESRHASVRNLSMQSWQSTGNSSRIPSSNVDVTVEDLQMQVNRMRQAQMWSQMPSSQNRDEEDQLCWTKNEPRLSDEEKKALENAMERSIDDVVGDFDRIFLVDSDSSKSGTGETDI
ncbi:hypothetical protein ACLMJK_001270 [Lecanora helva]